MKFETRILLATLAGCLVCLPMQAQMNGHNSGAQAINDPSLNGMSAMSNGETDALFLKKAADANMTEVAMGKMALSKSSNADVKTFAQKMVDDHTAMESDVETVAKSLNVTLPTALPKSEEKNMTKMQALDGVAFDKAFASGMVKDHKRALSDFRSENGSTQNSQIKDLTSKGAATIAQHLKMAQDLQAKVGK